MPAQTERLDVGLYCVGLSGTIQADDLFRGRDGVERLATADGSEHSVLMLDGITMQQVLFRDFKYKRNAS